MAVKVTTKPSLTAADLIGGTSGAPGAKSLRSGLGNVEYRKLVKSLHSKGIAVGTFDPNTPLALQPRTQTSLRSQAANTINSSYAPAESALNASEARVNAISAKRQSDMKAYQDWAAQTTAQFQVGTQAAQSAIMAKQQEIADNTRTSQDAATASVVAGMTPEQKATFLTSHPAFAVNASANNTKIAGQTGITAEAAHNALNNPVYDGSWLAANLAANKARLDAGDQQQLGDIQGQRATLLADKGAKGADLLDKLIAQEGANASTVQQTKSAQSALGIKQKEFNQTLNFKTQQGAATRATQKLIAGMANDTKRAAQDQTRAKFISDYGLDPTKVLNGGYTQKQLQAAHKRAKATGSKAGSTANPTTLGVGKPTKAQELQARNEYGHSYSWVVGATNAQLLAAKAAIKKATGTSTNPIDQAIQNAISGG